jgi:uncharacterized membrane protein
MSLWLILAIGAQFINSIVALIDKFLVTSKKVPRPSLYVFYTGILVIFSLLLYLLDFLFGQWINGLPSLTNVHLPTPYVVIQSTLTAIFFLSGLYFLFKALVKADASDVFPVVGSISAFFVLLLSFALFQKSLNPDFFFGFIFLAFGTLFVSHFRFGKKIFIFTILSSIFYGLHVVSMKKLFSDVGFDNGFFWYSSFIVIFSLFMLFIPSIRKSLLRHRKSTSIKSSDKIILIGKVLAGIGGLMYTMAIDQGDEAIVQSLGGLQYLFLFLFAIILGHRTSSDWGENVTKKDLLQKFIAMALILTGFVLLFI